MSLPTVPDRQSSPPEHIEPARQDDERRCELCQSLIASGSVCNRCAPSTGTPDRERNLALTRDELTEVLLALLECAIAAREASKTGDDAMAERARLLLRAFDKLKSSYRPLRIVR